MALGSADENEPMVMLVVMETTVDYLRGSQLKDALFERRTATINCHEGMADLDCLVLPKCASMTIAGDLTRSHHTTYAESSRSLMHRN